MQLLIPISNKSDFFKEDLYIFPKPLIEVDNMPMIELVSKYVKSQFNDATFIFVISSEIEAHYSLLECSYTLMKEGASQRYGPKDPTKCMIPMKTTTMK